MRILNVYKKRDSNDNQIFERVQETVIRPDQHNETVTVTMNRCGNCRTPLENDSTQQVVCGIPGCNVSMCPAPGCRAICSSCGRACCNLHRKGFGPQKVTLCAACLDQTRRYEKAMLKMELLKLQSDRDFLPGAVGMIQRLRRQQKIRNMERDLEEL